jgi:hypothetical protein
LIGDAAKSTTLPGLACLFALFRLILTFLQPGYSFICPDSAPFFRHPLATCFSKTELLAP